MSLTNVWLQMFDGSLVRADQVIEIELHPTPEVGGKPSHWLLDIVIAVTVGNGAGGGDGWWTGALHRTLTQTSIPPVDAPVALARLLAQLDAVDAAGVVRAEFPAARTAARHDRTIPAGNVLLGFAAFTDGNLPEHTEPVSPLGHEEQWEVSPAGIDHR